MAHRITVFQGSKTLECLDWAGGEESAIELARRHFAAEREKLGASGVIVADNRGRVVFAQSSEAFS